MSLSKREIERQETTPVEQLVETRRHVRTALTAAEEGDLKAQTFDEIARPLVLALRGLDALQLSLSALGRRAI